EYDKRLLCTGRQSSTSSEATEKEVSISDERVGIHLSVNKESSGWYVLYKLIVGGLIFDRKPEAVSRDKCCLWEADV
ncbi:hypothetical protein KY285_016736, partial [Solanum tuberosum]